MSLSQVPFLSCLCVVAMSLSRRRSCSSIVDDRSVVVRGLATKIEDPVEKLRTLKLITDHVVANWDEGRGVSAMDNRKTLVLEMSLDEASAKVRDGDPIDEDDDMAGPWWSGVIPVETRFGEAYPAADFAGSNEMPAQYGALAGKLPEER